ncbi:MAG: response regulator transcription factor, partial [Brevibacterium aurantiacum]
IAQELFVTEATVKSHLVNVFTKLGVESRSRAIRVAEDQGLV